MDGVVVDLATRTFAPLEATGAPPPARSHAAVAAVGGRLVVVGGQRPRDYAAARSGKYQASAGEQSSPHPLLPPKWPTVFVLRGRSF